MNRLTTPSHNARTIAVCFAAAMSVTALVLTAVTWSKMDGSLLALHEAMELRMEWKRSLSVVKEADAGQQGYVLTGDEASLQPLEFAKSALPDMMNGLSSLTLRSGKPDEAVKVVGQLMRQWLDGMSETVVVRRREGMEAALPMVQDPDKRRLMEEVSTRVLGEVGELERFIEVGTRAMHTDLRWGYASAIATGAMALLAGGVALLLLREAHLRARREERLMVEKNRAEESNQQKSTFLATMSHEIRTPMNAILGFGELLEEEVKSEKEKRYVQSILTGGRSLLQLINDILDLSKIDAGMMQLKEEPTDVRDLATFVKQLFGQQAAEKGVMLRVEVDEKLPHSLLLDGVRLRQILINVVGNALKFTDAGKVEVRFYGRAETESRQSRLNLHMVVEDTGRGIAPQFQREIFQPFIQVEESSRSTQLPGTGLGLTIVKRLTELVHGRVSMTSEVGKGTIFDFEFPGVTVSARLPMIQSGREDEVNFDDLRASKILVADDNETNRELLKGIFEGTNHVVRFACDGREAVELVVKEKPDVVLMDVRMPVMDGRQALRAIRAKKEFCLLPVIAVTASSLSADERQLRSSFDGYVRKPFSRQQLYRELAQFIARADAAMVPSKDVVSPVMGPEEGQRPVWRELAGRLREIEVEVWPRVRDGMLMSEVRAFAVNLLETGRTSRCAILESYAKRLLADIDSFSLSSLENGLQGFPNCIKEIEMLSNQDVA
jgi:signal transduction histidine kinase/CheY-like chemotaxis protein